MYWLLASHISAGYAEAKSPAGGLSVACYLRNGFDEDRTVAIAKSVGIELPTLRRLYLGSPARSGWLLGFAALVPSVAQKAMLDLSRALDAFYR